jgi:hypothetical protein
VLAAVIPLATLMAVALWSQLQIDRAAAAGALTTVGALALTKTIAWLKSGPIVRSLQHLGTDATEMAAGDLSHRTSNESLRLQQISTVLIQEGNLNSLYDRVLDAAIGVMSADMGSMQTFHPDQRELRLLADFVAKVIWKHCRIVIRSR